MSQPTNRPRWMESDSTTRPSTGHAAQPQSYIKSDLSGLHSDELIRSQSFPESVIVGVKIIAGLMLLNTSLTIGFLITALFEPKTSPFLDGPVFSDYITPWRMLFTLVIGVILSVGIWKAVEASN